MRVVVLASGSGSNLQALLEDQQGYTVVLIVTDRSRAGALQRAEQAGVPAAAVPLTQPRDAEQRQEWETQVATTIAAAEPDLVVMAGWMRVMSRTFVERFADRLINQHPALLPDDTADSYVLSDGRSIPAIRGAHAVRDALALGGASHGMHDPLGDAGSRCWARYPAHGSSRAARRRRGNVARTNQSRGAPHDRYGRARARRDAAFIIPR